MASSPAALIALMLLVASCAGMAAATTFNVGDGNGWATGVDYTNWASDKTFAVGDTLVFKYASKVHTVTEVTKSGYDSCSGSNSLSNDDTGSTTVTLTIPGLHYFICNIPGHCASGMKLVVTVTEGGSGSPSGGATPASAAGGALVPAMSSVVAAAAAAAAALIKLALF